MTKFIFLFCLAAVQPLLGQPLTISTASTNGWFCRIDNGHNFNPVSWAVATSGNNLNPIFINSNDCASLNLPLNLPAGQTNAIGAYINGVTNNCGTIPNTHITTFFETNFNLAAIPCTALLSVQADDYFRVYINGTQVNQNLLGAHCIGGGIFDYFHNLNGNDWHAPVDFTNLANMLVTGNNKMVIEVAQCVDVSWMSCLLTIYPFVNPDPGMNPHINYIASNGKLTLTGESSSNKWAGITGETWNVERSSSMTGPWGDYAFRHTDGLGGPFYINIPSCIYLRITHTLTRPCGTSTEVLIIYVCLSGQPVVISEEFAPSPDQTIDRSEVIVSPPSPELYPNPVSQILTISNIPLFGSKLTLINTIGKTVLNVTLEYGTTTKYIDVSSVVNGLYFIQIIDNNNRMILAKKLEIFH